MKGTVRYTSGDNSVLRYALYEAWSMKCYWCSRPREYNLIEIDHIIPKTIEDAALKLRVKDYDLPADFDVHDPHNLAPICKPCNGAGTKGSTDHTAAGVVLSHLKKAEGLRWRVIQTVETFPKSGALAKTLVDAIKVDLRDKKARATFEDYAPALVQKLALLGEDKVQDYVTLRYVEVTQEPFEAGVSLDAEARKAVAILEDVCGGSLDDLLKEPLRELYLEIHERAENELQGEGLAGPYDVGSPDGYVRIDIDAVHFDRIGRYFSFTFEGNFEADLDSCVLQSGRDGTGLDALQGSAQVVGKFELNAWWEAPDGDEEAEMNTENYDITEWECSSYVE